MVNVRFQTVLCYRYQSLRHCSLEFFLRATFSLIYYELNNTNDDTWPHRFGHAMCNSLKRGPLDISRRSHSVKFLNKFLCISRSKSCCDMLTSLLFRILSMYGFETELQVNIFYKISRFTTIFSRQNLTCTNEFYNGLYQSFIRLPKNANKYINNDIINA